jgi:predicted enzyme related to lactoylglutathione lyase
VAVDDCDDTATRVIELGGQLLMSPIDLPHVGRYAILKDPVGARMAIVRHARH